VTGTGPRALAVFDLCDTLYAENTTFGFIRWFHRRDRRSGRLALLRLLSARWLPAFWVLAAVHRLLGVDVSRRLAVSTLRGAGREALEAAARDYAAGPLGDRAVSATQARLAQHRAAGDRVVIVSSSLDIVVSAVASRLGVEGIGSRLGFRNGLCRGRIEEDLTGRKAAVVATLVARAPERPVVHVYTDNLSDRDLVAAADRPTVVIPAGRSRAGWGETDAAFLEL